jgi:two-component system sensor histidine kinase CiaH
MFHSARLSLTLWYLLVITIICIAFSFVIYILLRNELAQFEQQTRNRQGAYYQSALDLQACQAALIVGPDVELISQWEDRLKRRLVAVNGLIVITSGVFAFFLSTKTLRPIQQMVSEQQRFISDASHELRTPIAAVKSEIEVALRDKNLSVDESKKVLHSSLEEVNRLNGLVNQLLVFNKHRTKAELQSVSIESVLRLATKRTEMLAAQKQITVKLHTQNTQVLGVPDRLVEVFVILLDNAIKYSKPGGVVNVSSMIRLRELRVNVRDEGVGIPKEDIPHIFDRFYRGEKSRSRTQTDGFGLGLSIAESTVSQFGGKITVKSQVGKGSVFTVVLNRGVS